MFNRWDRLFFILNLDINLNERGTTAV
eukprot:SAG31_NODE_21390_length_550_cov_59.088692_1_plen_26_part_01